MSTILVLRHGKSDHNLGSEAEHTFAGSKTNKGLSPDGIKSAKNLAGKLQTMGGCDILVASNLKRSQETTTIISKIISTPVITIKDLEEIDIGDFIGHTEAEVKQLYPAEAIAFYNGDIPNWSFPNGEDYGAVVKRVKSVTRQLIKLSKNYVVIAVVGHAMFNRVWFHEALLDRKDLWHARTYPHDRIIRLNIDVRRSKK